VGRGQSGWIVSGPEADEVILPRYRPGASSR
jgi:hypothetical protein